MWNMGISSLHLNCGPQQFKLYAEQILHLVICGQCSPCTNLLDTTGLSKVICWFWCFRSRASIWLSPEHLQVQCETHNFSLSSNSAFRRPHSVSTSAQAGDEAVPVRKRRDGNYAEWLIQPSFLACAHGFQVLDSHPALVAVWTPLPAWVMWGTLHEQRFALTGILLCIAAVQS